MGEASYRRNGSDLEYQIQNIKENVWKKCLKVKWKCLFWKCFQLLETLFVSCVSHVLFKLKEVHLTLVFYRQTGRRFHRKIPCSKKHTSHGSPTWPCDITVWPAMRAIRHRCFCRCCTRFAFFATIFYENIKAVTTCSQTTYFFKFW